MKAQLELRDRALSATAEGVVIADARLPDNPIIYANAGFERLTGYSVEDVMGRNCRFLQGPSTDPDTLERLRSAIHQKQECTVQLLNYRKDGSTFWNRLSITPIRDAAGEVTHYIGVQSDITEQKRTEEALQAANRNLEAAAERLKHDLEAAAAVQRALLPSALPQVPGINLAWAFRPCQAARSSHQSPDERHHVDNTAESISMIRRRLDPQIPYSLDVFFRDGTVNHRMPCPQM